MKRYVAFLRGINVGGRTIKMHDLKQCFEQAGYTDVVTVLASGNVVFGANATDTNALENDVEKAIGAAFGYDAHIFVLAYDKLAGIVAGDPFERENDEHHYVIFNRPEVSDELMARSAKLDDTVERIEYGDDVIYWTVPKGMTLKSEFAKVLASSAYKDKNTVRNINTIEKIVKVGQK